MYIVPPYVPTYRLVRQDGTVFRFSSANLSWNDLRPLGCFSHNLMNGKSVRYINDYTVYSFFRRDSFYLYDEADMLVDVRLIAEAETVVSWVRWRPHAFRHGPVWGIRKWRPSRRYYRDPKTQQEISENAWLDHDPEMREYGIRSRAKRRTLPNDRDDVISRNQRCWKAFRKTRWR
jgi:hypothetical protein